jgi:hypothetical protein
MLYDDDKDKEDDEAFYNSMKLIAIVEFISLIIVIIHNIFT